MLTNPKVNKLIKENIYLFLIILPIVIIAQDSFNLNKLKEQLTYGITDSARVSVNYELGDYYLESENDSSYYYYKRALDLTDKINDSITKSYILHNLGYKYDLDNNHKMALETYFKAKDRYVLNKDSLGVARIENNIGFCFMHLYDENKAIEHYLKSMALYRELNNEDGIATNLTDIASLYYDFENYDFAIKKYKEALKIYEKFNNLEGVSGAYTNLANAISDKGNYGSGLNYYAKSIEIQEKMGDTLGLAVNYNNIGDSYIQMKQYKIALEYFKKALIFNKVVKDEDLESIIYLNIADAELNLKHYRKAIKDARKSLEISEKIGNVSYSIENYKSLATCYERVGNKNLALEFLNKYRKLQDSLNQKDNKKKIQLFNALNELEESEFKMKDLENKKKIAELKYDNEKKIIYFLIISSIIFCILLIVLINQQGEKKKAYNLLSFKNHQIKRMNDEIQIQSDNLKRINNAKDKFFSIIAHDLKNPFNSIKGFSELMIENIGEYDKGKQLKFLKIIKGSATKASNLLNNLLIWANSQSGNLKFEPKTLNLYDVVDDIKSLVEIQAINKEITLINTIDTDVNVFADENMLSAIIRNLLSNAIKFTNNGGTVEIASERINGNVQIMVKDNGVGMNEETFSKLFNINEKHVGKGTNNEQGTGLGLILCKDFVEKHNGKIWVNSKENEGSEFVFTLPVYKK